jgi:hypothetical protein
MPATIVVSLDNPSTSDSYAAVMQTRHFLSRVFEALSHLKKIVAVESSSSSFKQPAAIIPAKIKAFEAFIAARFCIARTTRVNILK